MTITAPAPVQATLRRDRATRNGSADRAAVSVTRLMIGPSG